MPDQICFPQYQGLPFDYRAPELDGYSEWEIGLNTTEIESGWTGASRLTFGDSSGVPLMSFQALRDKASPTEFIYLSFVIRQDLAFSEFDTILMIFQQPAQGGVPAETRRLIINPLVSAGAGTPSNDNPAAVDRPPADLQRLRSNHYVSDQFYRLNGNAFAQIPDITNYTARSRSWKISETDYCWSVEIKLPVLKAGANGGGANWINLNDPAGFGFYFHVFRFSTPSSVINLDQLNTQFIWPRSNPVFADNPATGVVVTSIDTMGMPTTLGVGSLADGCSGVRFDGGWGAIGVESGASVSSVIQKPPTTNVFIAKIKNDGANPASRVNATFRLANFGIGPSPNGDWKVIDNHTPPAPDNTNPTAYKSVAAGGTQSLKMKWLLSQSPASPNDVDTYRPVAGDQCLLVELDSDSGVDFAERSMRKNMSFNLMSVVEREVEISGKHGSIPDASHDILLVTSKRLLSSTENYDGWTARAPLAQAPQGDIQQRPAVGRLDPKKGYEQDGDQRGLTAPWLANEVFSMWSRTRDVTYTWIVVTAAYRRTAQTITLNGTAFPIYEALDSFSHILTHEGAIRAFTYQFTGPGLTKRGDGVYQLAVPNGGQVTLKVRAEAVPIGGCLVLVLRLLEQLGPVGKLIARLLKQI
jgi:hypothetical protein